MQESIKERPILFSAPMVRALLDGSKTQTRRIVKPLKDSNFGIQLAPCEIAGEVNKSGRIDLCPYGKVGDRLWVRETTKADYDTSDTVVLAKYSADDAYVFYDHDDEHKQCIDHWWYSKDVCPSIHMPRDKSRINLEITAVRVERLNDISESDAKNEGAPDYEEGVDTPPPDDGEYKWSYVTSFQRLLESINGAGSWQENPWVWVVEFKVVK